MHELHDMEHVLSRLYGPCGEVLPAALVLAPSKMLVGQLAKELGELGGKLQPQVEVRVPKGGSKGAGD